MVAWREVPVDVSAVGPIALKTMPRMRQVFIESQAGLTGDELERELFIVRKLMEKEKVGRGGGRAGLRWAGGHVLCVRMWKCAVQRDGRRAAGAQHGQRVGRATAGAARLCGLRPAFGG